MPISSPFPPLHIPNVTFAQFLYDAIQQHAAANPLKLALIDPDEPSQRVYYGDLLDRVNQLRSALTLHLCLNQGDTIMMVLPNSVDYVMLNLAAMASGIVLSLCNPAATADEIQRQLIDSAAKCVFVHRDTEHAAVEAIQGGQVPLVKHFVVQNPSARRMQCCHHVSETVVAHDLLHLYEIDVANKMTECNGSPTDVAILPYSSGTTGVPKGVMLTHVNLLANNMMFYENAKRLMWPLLSPPCLNPTDLVDVQFLPLYHIFGFGWVYLMLKMGCTSVIMHRFDPLQYFQLIQTYRPRLLALVPPVAIALAKHPNVTNYNLHSIEMALCGAAPLRAESEIELKNVHKNIRYVFQGWGMTELSSGATMAGMGQPGNCGLLLPSTECKIVDPDTGSELAIGEPGEVCIRSPCVMKGYLNKPDATKQTIDEDGFIHSGDIGYYDNQCFVYIVDRIKEMIKVKAYQVAPAELEGVLLSHPGVTDAAVIGMPDERSGEAPFAYIVKKHERLTEQDVHDFVNARVSAYKRLEGGIKFVSSIPKSPSGKILRKLLRQQQGDRSRAKL